MKKTKRIIGEKFVAGNGLEFEIIAYSNKYNYRKIRFLKSGYETEVFLGTIKDGCQIKDYLTPTIAGIGVVDVPGASTHILRNRWSSMIKRCYDDNNPYYKTYGAKGYYVDSSWHKLSNYIKDIEQKENYDKLLEDSTAWEIDKDILTPGNKCYSNETTLIVSKTQNLKEQMGRCGNPNPEKPVYQYTKYGEFIQRYDSTMDAERRTNISHSTISSCCNGKQKTSGGYIWRFELND